MVSYHFGGGGLAGSSAIAATGRTANAIRSAARFLCMLADASIEDAKNEVPDSDRLRNREIARPFEKHEIYGFVVADCRLRSGNSSGRSFHPRCIRPRNPARSAYEDRRNETSTPHPRARRDRRADHERSRLRWQQQRRQRQRPAPPTRAPPRRGPHADK